MTTVPTATFFRSTNANYCLPGLQDLLFYPYYLEMTSTHASNTTHKHADPYKQKNLDLDTNLKEKVEGLVSFAEGLKFGLMTTRQNESGMLVSRCMAVAGRVCSSTFFF